MEHRTVGLRMRWIAALITAMALVAVAGPAHAAPKERPQGQPGQHYYLSLGDSLAFGFQRAKALAGLPPSAFDTGYSDLLANRLRHGRRPLALVNYGCPGESTTTFRAGPCPWSLWSNDANAFIASCAGDARCIIDGAPAAIAAFKARLDRILREIRRTAPDTTVVLLGAVDANIGPAAEFEPSADPRARCDDG